MRIDLICPSRSRPQRFKAMVDSALALATHPESVITYLMLDRDDPKLEEYALHPQVALYMNQTPGRSVPAMMNELSVYTQGDLLFAASDDILFRTTGWDDILRETFERHEDRLLVAYTNDGRDRDKCTHFAVHRRWLEVSGYYVWPGFEHFYADEWCYRIGAAIGRSVYLRNLVTEHMHYRFGKSKKDETYASKRNDGQSERDAARMKELLPLVDEISGRMRSAMVN
jgi:glycosyl transferase/beta-hydroxylase protein BlmF